MPSTVKIVSTDAANALEASSLSPLLLGLGGIVLVACVFVIIALINTRKQVSLKAKIILLLSSVFSLFLIYSLLSYFSISSLRAISDEFEEIAKTKLPTISYVMQITQLQTEQKVYFERFLRSRAGEDRQALLSFDGRIKEVIASADAHIQEALMQQNAAEKAQGFIVALQRNLVGIKEKHQLVIESCDRLLAQLTSRARVDLSQVATVLTRCNRESEELSNKVSEFLTAVEKEVNNATKAVLAAEQNTIAIIIDIALFSLVWGILVIIGIWRGARNLLKQIDTTIRTLHHSAQEVGSASENLIASSSTLETVAHQQSSTVERATTTVARNEEIMSTNLERVESSHGLSRKISEIAEQAERSMASLVDSMNKITESNERIQQLVAIIEEIGEKTKVIEEIVFQTKLISFNTAVEAERAGEYGRGFAVIAQEVGKLAQLSGSASKDISHKVAETKDAAQEIARENRERVKNGNQLVEETSRILKEISQSSHAVIEGAGLILQTSKEQQVAITHLNRSLMEIEKATQQNLAMAQQTAAASSLLNHQSKNLTTIVDDLLEAIFSSEKNNK